MTAALELKNITMEFQSRKHMFRVDVVRAVDDVSLRLNQGETLGIVGESGSGKTTLARIALRLQKPTSGTISYLGYDITFTSENKLGHFRRKVQGIFQDPFAALDPFMNIGQILEEPLIIHHLGNSGERNSAIESALAEVKLNPARQFVTKYTHLLSGGQRQRVAIARALLLKPDYIVADEPVSMIDASSRAEILSLFAELQNNHNLGFLYITHDIATAGYFCRQVAVMYLGRVVEYGPAREVICSPKHPYTINLIAAIPTPDPQNRFRERSVIPLETVTVDSESCCAFMPRCDRALEGECDCVKPVLREIDPGHFVACTRV
ncbi:MAG: ATP-binding cassette domain-containing protein [Dehalogenimonas sp.]|uniref:Oligopeptide/dipeptide ABC transporter ATP-binding protein n=1 Tax=Candidatus Dehalogenimonas loeffleri TaxID=3127115 RepID=A0ABZ2JAA8_9CHLR|nr:ATP-binding cassette domain-containing protein [Dehalogenimonas sp.]